MINENYIKNMIKKHEGFRDHVYKDSVGVLTGGWGHAFYEKSKLSDLVVKILFEEDFNDAKEDFKHFQSKHRLWLLNDVREAVLIDMMFNLGYVKLSKFEKFIAAMQDENYLLAADEMKDSKWYKQVGVRGQRLREMMKTGEIE